MANNRAIGTPTPVASARQQSRRYPFFFFFALAISGCFSFDPFIIYDNVHYSI
jgi:hypothetical protein